MPPTTAMDKAEAWLWDWGHGWTWPVKQSFTEGLSRAVRNKGRVKL